MKRLLALTLASCLVVCIGCETTSPAGSKANRRIVQSITDMAIQNAIMTQHTLYPYHFEFNGGALNELGQRELDVIICQYRARPGPLNVRRADTPEPVYLERLAFVRDALGRGGVDVSRVVISDGLPGGSGRPADEVIAINHERNSPTEPLYYDNGSSGAVIEDLGVLTGGGSK